MAQNQEDRPIFKKINEAVNQSIHILREQMLKIEDLGLLSENFITGINLVLLRRYSDVERDLEFECQDELLQFFEEEKNETSIIELYSIVNEITNNDLKYGQGVAKWNFYLEDGNLITEMNAESSYHLKKHRTGRGTENLIYRISGLGGKVEMSLVENVYKIKINIPIGNFSVKNKGVNTIMKNSEIKVGIVENDESFKEQILKTLESIPEIGGVFHWGSAESFWEDEKGRSLDIIFLDIMLAEMNGVELAGKISARDPEIAKIMLSNMNSDELIYESLKNGAIGYILKSELKDIADVVDTILKGGAIITPTIAFRVLNSFKQKDYSGEFKLTPKEKQILDEMVKGKTIGRVAEFLKVSKYTVQHHVKNIYKKLNVHNRAELVRKASDIGLLP